MYRPVNGAGGTLTEVEEQRRGTKVSRGETGVRGIGVSGKGMGGTSYISATIQCLYTLPPLCLFFREEFWRLSVQSEVAYAVANAFRAVKSGTGELRAMQSLREAVGRRDKVFRLHQDPPEGQHHFRLYEGEGSLHPACHFFGLLGCLCNVVLKIPVIT